MYALKVNKKCEENKLEVKKMNKKNTVIKIVLSGKKMHELRDLCAIQGNTSVDEFVRECINKEFDRLSQYARVQYEV